MNEWSWWIELAAGKLFDSSHLELFDISHLGVTLGNSDFGALR